MGTLREERKYNKMKILYVKANPKDMKDSVSNLVSDRFIKRYSELNPNDVIDVLDLYKEEWPHLNKEALDDYGKKEGILFKTATRFAEYDKYIFSAPMWNLSIPSILKAYFDHILVSGITFKYTKWGIPVGLLKNKKAICIIARGGNYSYWPLSKLAFDKNYLNSVLKFIGIKKIKFLTIDNVKNYNNFDMLVEKSAKKINIFAKEF